MTDTDRIFAIGLAVLIALAVGVWIAPVLR